MAIAVRALARRAGRAFQHLSTPAVSSASSCAIDESLFLRSFSSFSVTHPRSSHAEEIAKLRGVPHFSVCQSSRVYSTGVDQSAVVEEAEYATVEDKEQPNAVITPPPRPFRLTPTIRALAAEVGYKVIDRYTEEDFGRNKKPKAFAVVQVWFYILLHVVSKNHAYELDIYCCIHMKRHIYGSNLLPHVNSKNHTYELDIYWCIHMNLHMYGSILLPQVNYKSHPYELHIYWCMPMNLHMYGSTLLLQENDKYHTYELHIYCCIRMNLHMYGSTLTATCKFQEMTAMLLVV